MTRPGARANGARRNRATSVALVAAFLLATHACLPDADGRTAVQYLFVVTLGYGHLLGALVLARPRSEAVCVSSCRALVASFRTVSVLAGFAAYAWVVERVPALILPLLAVSAWHTVENDLAIGRAYASGLRVGAIPRALAHHAVSLGVTGVVFLLGTWTESWRELAAGVGWTGTRTTRPWLPASAPLADWVDLPDLFVLVTLHHLLSWLLFLGDRVRALRRDRRTREAARLLARLAVVHLAPASVCVGVLSIPRAQAESLHLLVFGPAVYLYWSVLHVVQTCWRRGLEARGPVARVETTLVHS